MNNYSKQRKTVLEAIKNTRTHPTAEKIYSMALKEEPKISKSTVYRNINILVENGVIKRITIPNRPDRYDYLYDNHQHAICTECGKVFDFYYSFDKEKIEESIREHLGKEFEIDCVKIVGICENCKSKNKN